MPQTLENIMKKNPYLSGGFDVVIINEVDKIARRTAHTRILTRPWSSLIPRFEDAFIAAMSGTLRDNHIVLDGEQAQIRTELKAITDAISNSEQTYGFIGTSNEKAISGLTRKLTHYGKYSYLGFEGDAPDNVLKGVFPALNSPLNVSLDNKEITGKEE